MAGTTSLQDIRNYARSYVEVDQTDVPDLLIDAWTQEGFDDLIGDDVRWPFYEVGGVNGAYSVTTTNGVQMISLPTVTNLPNQGTLTANVFNKKVIAIQGPHWELLYADQAALESTFTPAFIVQQEPERYSYWGQTGITLWPIPNAAYTLNIRAYREPTDWVTAAGVVDAPEDFQAALKMYVLGNALAQQTDLGQAGFWLTRYADAKQRLRKKYLRAPLPENLRLNRGQVTRELPPRLRFPFEGLNQVGLGE